MVRRKTEITTYDGNGRNGETGDLPGGAGRALAGRGINTMKTIGGPGCRTDGGADRADVGAESRLSGI